MASDKFHQADLRTLALARPDVTAAELDRFIAYQEALVELTRGGLPLAQAHVQALEKAGLPAASEPALTALCRDFAGKRSTVQRVRESLAKARGKGDTARAAALEPELARLDSLEYWRGRYGEQVVGWLQEREARLVALHAKLRGRVEDN